MFFSSAVWLKISSSCWKWKALVCTLVCFKEGLLRRSWRWRISSRFIFRGRFAKRTVYSQTARHTDLEPWASRIQCGSDHVSAFSEHYFHFRSQAKVWSVRPAKTVCSLQRVFLPKNLDSSLQLCSSCVLSLCLSKFLFVCVSLSLSSWPDLASERERKRKGKRVDWSLSLMI